ncbi:hypothetical protein GCM10027020_19990 [Nocardioides salsibiostraticola]
MAYCDRMRIVLLGDSHLAKVQNDLPRLRGSLDESVEIANLAIGGSIAVDLHQQAEAAQLRPTDLVVVSIGTNDAAQWRPIDRRSFEESLGAFLGDLEVARLVVVTSPGTDEGRIGDTGPDFPPEQIAAYSETVERLATAVGAEIVRTPELLAPLGGRAFLDDGVHLTGEGYDVLLPAIAAAVSG